MKLKVIFAIISIAALIYIVCIFFGRSKYFLAHDSDAYAQIPFNEEAWKSAKPVANEKNARAQMKSSVQQLFAPTSQLRDITAKLGEPNITGKRGNFGFLHQSALSKLGNLFCIYTVSITSEGDTDDLVFSFDKSENLISIIESANVY